MIRCGAGAPSAPAKQRLMASPPFSSSWKTVLPFFIGLPSVTEISA